MTTEDLILEELRGVRRDVSEVKSATARVDERTKGIQANHEREIRATHHRIGEVREELITDVAEARKAAEAGDKAVRGEVKRLTGLISAGVSAVVAAVGAGLKGMLGGP